MGGIVGEMRVGGMSLHAMHSQPPRHAAAPADLDHVAQRLRAGRLADETGVDRLTAILEPTEHLARAIDGLAFLVPGDQQADRSGEVSPTLIPALIEEALRRRDEGGDCSLHVDCAAAAQRAITKAGREGIEGPGFGTPGGHDIGMAGETQIGAAIAAARVEVMDIAKDQTVTVEPQLLQCGGNEVERTFILRGDARPADQRGGEFRRVESRLAHSRSSSLIEVRARVPSSTFLTMTAP